jgi:hypothetical protein
MNDPLCGAQIVAARALVGISRVKLAARAGVDIAEIERLEMSGPLPLAENEVVRKLRATLGDIGAVFIGEANGRGAGVRLRFSRSTTRAIGKWEGEGGLPADDEVP